MGSCILRQHLVGVGSFRDCRYQDAALGGGKTLRLRFVTLWKKHRIVAEPVCSRYPFLMCSRLLPIIHIA